MATPGDVLVSWAHGQTGQLLKYLDNWSGQEKTWIQECRDDKKMNIRKIISHLPTIFLSRLVFRVCFQFSM